MLHLQCYTASGYFHGYVLVDKTFHIAIDSVKWTGVQQANLQFSERVCGLLQFRLHRGSHSVTPGLVFAILNTRRFGQYKTWTADCGLRTADWV